MVEITNNFNPIKRLSVPNLRYSVGLGYVIVPYNVDREQYVENCFRTNLVELLTENSEFILDVEVDKFSIQLLDFPKENGKLGSLVVWVNEVNRNKPYVVAVLSKRDEFTDLREGEIRFKKSGNDNSSLLKLQGNKGNLFISAENSLGKEENGIFIDVKNKKDLGKLIAYCQGETSLTSEKDITLTTAEKVIIKSKNNKEEVIEQDSKSDIKKNWNVVVAEDTQFQSNIYFVQNSQGYSVKELLDEIITEISNITVQTALGVMPIINKIQVEALKQKVAQLFR